MHRDNHYVPRSYLKRWADDDSKLWSYRVLVSDARVPLWRRVSTRGVAYHEHLYTKVAAAGESDELERWLDAEFEAPAEQAIERVVENRRLAPSDWLLLARFFAAQDVRTPARLHENNSRWSESLPGLIRTTMKESVAMLDAMSPEEKAKLPRKQATGEDVPFRVTIERREGLPGGWLKGETVSGRRLWTWSIERLLRKPSEALRTLCEQRWTILAPPAGERWFTSDDPVLKLNFNSLTEYSFDGGWGSRGTDLMLPLGPQHLLFTQVGKAVPPRGTRMDKEKAALVRRLVAEHAHRHIFADTPDPSVQFVRPRIVDAAELKRETLEWQRWHAEQSAAERDLMP